MKSDRRPCGRSGLCSAFSRSHLQVQSVSVVMEKATIHLTGKLYLGGVCDIPRVRGQLTSTALQFPSVHAVHIYVNSFPLSRDLSQC